MTDYADRSAAISEVLLKASLGRVVQDRDRSIEFIYCCDCGAEIPEKRRQVVPGCRLCVACQQQLETRN